MSAQSLCINVLTTLLFPALLSVLLPSSTLATDHIIDDTVDSCQNIGGIWDSEYADCTVSGWTLPEGDILTILPGGELRVSGTGNLNAGTIYNRGILAVNGDGIDENEISNTGMISNTGRLDVGGFGAAGLVANRGAIKNGGAIHLWSDVYNGRGSTVTSSGVVSNLTTGTIFIDSGIVVPYGCCSDGTFENDGTVYNAGAITNYGVILNRNSLANDTTGVIDLRVFSSFDWAGRGGGYSQALLQSGGSLRNAGTIDSLGGTLHNAGNFENTGNFSSTGLFITVSTFYGTDTLFAGTVNNTSTISNTGVIALCNVDWVGNAPQGAPAMHRSCRAWLPFVEAAP